MSEKLIACCGIDCTNCDMRLATDDPDKQQEIAKWFKDNLNKNIKPEDVGCTWCRGDRTPGKHWSDDCWILQCCVDRHGREHCSECPDFICDKLREWAGQNDRYGEALERLRTMKAETAGV